MKFSCHVHAVRTAALLVATLFSYYAAAADHVKDLQTKAITEGHAPWGYWGPDPAKYAGWTNHSNRLIPAYTFGIDLSAYRGEHSIYRDETRLAELYGRLPPDTFDAQVAYFDQTDIARLQRAAVAAGKKNVIVIVFDGMDWQTTQAAAIYKSGKVGYREGRGTGLDFLDYRGAPTDFGYFVSSPYCAELHVDIDAQTVLPDGEKLLGGYCARHGGLNPWTPGDDPGYLIAKLRECQHAVTDSAASATSLFAGIKTYNDSINVDPQGRQATTVAHELQAKGFAIGVVTSVPISHATPGCTYSHNVWRDDFQDITRDLLGLPSVAHRNQPLAGVDVLLGAGWGISVETDSKQGANFIPGNKYLTDKDLARIDANHGGRYVVAQRQAGTSGRAALATAATSAADKGNRLLGFYGTATAHLPFATADGGYDPTIGVRRLAEVYSPADLAENPTLADMSQAALTVLSTNKAGFWLMIEAGDVDWANHDDNLDNSIGAVLSGDAAFRTVVDWVEAHSNWDETAVILTADHGHYLHLVDATALLPNAPAAQSGSR